MSTVEINKENRKKFFCEKCHYSCNKKSEFEKHINTIKHNTSTIHHKKTTEHICNCGKIYSHRGSLHNHKKKCNYKKKDAFMELVKQNRELKELIINQNKQIIEILETQQC